jgi:tetratricopeptide (TPR) repeat protein
MTRKHLSAEMARSFFKNTLDRAEMRWVLRHLLTRCRRCSELMMKVAADEGFLSSGRRTERDYASISDLLIFPAAEAFDLALGKVIGLAQFAYLEKLTQDTRLKEVEEDKSFHHLGLYQRLIEVADLVGRSEPQEGIELAQVAIAVAQRIRSRAAFRDDLIGGAYCIIGNARRIAGDVAGSHLAFVEAEDYLGRGTGDPMATARLYQYQSSLLVDLGQYEQAELVLRSAYSAYRRIGDRHRQGRTLLQIGTAAVHHDPQRAVGYFRRAERLFDIAEEPILEICLRHNLAWCLNEIGKPGEALALLDSSRRLYRRFDKWVRMRMYWLEARIAYSFDRFLEAEKILTLLWGELHEDGKHPLELTLVSVDLLQVMDRNGKREECVALVRTLIPILEHLGLHTEGMAVWVMVHKRLREGVIQGTIWKRLSDYFRATWKMPAAFEETESVN